MNRTEQIHATCAAIDGLGVLLMGPSGAGKSDLALRLINDGAQLVADDRVDVSVAAGGNLVASAPAPLAGLLEVRGVGIVRLEYLAEAGIVLAAELVPRQVIERLPLPETATFCGLPLPLVRLAPFEASAPAKLRIAVRAHADDSILDGGLHEPPPE